MKDTSKKKRTTRRKKTGLRRAYPQVIGVAMALLLTAFMVQSFADEEVEGKDITEAEYMLLAEAAAPYGFPEVFYCAAQVTKYWSSGPGITSPSGNYFETGNLNQCLVDVHTPWGVFVTDMWCASPGIASPGQWDVFAADATCTFVEYDAAERVFVYYVQMHFPEIESWPWYFQDFDCGWIRIPLPEAPFKIIKSSANPSMTDGNSCYSLEGAVYGIYPTQFDAVLDTNRIATLTTDATGETQAQELAFDTYWIREIVAPLGYALDTTIYIYNMDTATPDQDGTYVLQLTDNPRGDPAPVRIQKLDTLTGEAYGVNDPAGLNLAGAQFTWRYFDGYYTTVVAAEASGAPTRTWVLETKASGIARYSDMEPNLNYLTPTSDPIYHDASNNPMIPLGTVIIQETKAPDAYLLPSPNPVYILLITIDSSGNIVRTLYKDGVLVGDISNLNEYTLNIDEAPHSAKVTKISAHTGEAIPNTEFTLYKESSKGANDWAVVTVKKTGTDGLAIFSPLTPGSYKLEETAANPLYSFEEGSVVKYFDITTSVVTVEYVVENTTCTVEVVKTDSETSEAIPNTEFTLYRESSKGAGDWEVVSVKTTNTSGVVSFAPLSIGSYKVEETASNPAYIFEAGIYVEYFEVTVETTRFDFAFENTACKVEVLKTDSESGAAIPDTEFTLYVESSKGAGDWAVVSVKKTNAAGTVSFPLVSAGSYKIEETASNPAYIFEEGVHVQYFDVTYETGTLTFAFENTASEVEITKTDSESGAAIADTEFTLYVESSKGAGDWVAIAVGKTDTAGKLTFPLLTIGSYMLLETASNPAYIFEEGVHVEYFEVSGQIGTLTFAFENTLSSVEVTKTDSESGAAIPDTEFTLYIESEKGAGDWAVVAVGKTDATGKLTFPLLAIGSYMLLETAANPAYIFEEGIHVEYFEVSGQIGTITFAFENTLSSVEVTKTDSESGEAIPDTEFTLYVESSKGAGDWAVVAVGKTNAAGKLTFPLLTIGSYMLLETASNPAYIFEEGIHVQYFEVSGQIGILTFAFENTLSSVEVVKTDSESGAAIPDTEFTLYKESTKGAGDWVEVSIAVTDKDGKLVFSPVVTGSYKLVETRPNPEYATAEESGDSERYFELVPSSTGQVQVFEDMVIQVSVEVYKDTINITSAAFKTFDEDYIQVNNIGKEEYAYRVGFRSTSNVRADEFTVIDPMENAQLGQVRLTQLWTPVVFGDTDGLFNLWYRTNLTDPTCMYSTANAMDSNPFNVNNPENIQVYSSLGWKLWAEGLPTTETTHLLVSDLNLADDEYITGVRYEYGSVEVGFTTGNGLIPIQQVWKPNLDWTPVAAAFAPSAQATGLYPAYYLVVCPTGIAPPEEIHSSVTAQIARNVVLLDDDIDRVVTTTIAPFYEEFVPVSFPDPYREGETPDFPFPQTGDTRLVLIVAVAAIAVLALVVLIVGIRWGKRGRR